MKNRYCMVSVDVEEDLNSNPKTYRGVENLNPLLVLFEKYHISSTLFVTGDVLEKYPQDVLHWSKRHEIASHGNLHRPLSLADTEQREEDLRAFLKTYERILGRSPLGFRAPQHTIDQTQFRLLEKLNFQYDSSVVSNYLFLRKYVGFKGKAPKIPYFPDSSDYKKQGRMKILEIPNPGLAGGFLFYGTWIRYFGPYFYSLLLDISRLHYLSLAVHSWDTVVHRDRFQRNSGQKFFGIMESLLKKMRREVAFLRGDEIRQMEARIGISSRAP
jgi:hypothetical protein